MPTATFLIERYEPGDPAPRVQEFRFEYPAGMTVLTGLYHILENVDPSIAFRAACRAGVCGSCAMYINGLQRLACETQIAHMGDVVRVGPLPGFAVLKDLVVDMEPFWRSYERVKPYLIHNSQVPEREFRQSPKQYYKLREAVNCILCGACTASCPSSWGDSEYLGPAAMLKAYRFNVDSRDEGVLERLEIVGSEEGAWRCHTVYNCVEACPKHLNPTEAIQALKRASVAKRLGFIR